MKNDNITLLLESNMTKQKFFNPLNLAREPPVIYPSISVKGSASNTVRALTILMAAGIAAGTIVAVPFIKSRKHGQLTKTSDEERR
jgi:hypothetical protein